MFNAQYCIAVQVKVFRASPGPPLLQLHIITLVLSLSHFDCFPVYVQIICQRHVKYSKQYSMHFCTHHWVFVLTSKIISFYKSFCILLFLTTESVKLRQKFAQPALFPSVFLDAVAWFCVWGEKAERFHQPSACGFSWLINYFIHSQSCIMGDMSVFDRAGQAWPFLIRVYGSGVENTCCGYRCTATPPSSVLLFLLWYFLQDCCFAYSK